MVHSDINRIYKMKCKLQHLKDTIGRPNRISSPLQDFRDFEAMVYIQKAIEELHEAEMCLRK